MSGLLAGVRVVSLAQQYPGPYCTMLLADLGADVILIEQPDGGDPVRGFDKSSSFFNTVNRGKRSVTLNLKSEAGKRLCWELLATADVFVEGFRPGVMDRLGFGHESVLAQHPRLIYCSISGYGQNGPYRDRPAHDLSYQALTGLVAAALLDDPTAYHSPVGIADLSAAMFATVGILGALFGRERSGCGRFVDVSMTDGLVSWMGVGLDQVLNGASVPRRAAADEPGYGIYRCGDGGYITLSIAHEQHFWRNLCLAIDRADLVELDRRERRARHNELREIIAVAMATRPRDEWVERLARADVASGPVLSPAEVVQNPHLQARGMFASTDDGARRVVAHPLKFSGDAVCPPTAAPDLGEHTTEVLAELGRTAGEIEALRAADAI